MNKLEIMPVQGPVDFSIQPPGSKSITNRALLCAALANGTSTLSGVLNSDDTRVMIEGLRQVGIEIQSNSTNQGTVIGGKGATLPCPTARIDVEGSGTTIRFLTAALSATGGQYVLDGIQRMRARPIGDLVGALSQLGAQVTTENNLGFPPVKINSHGLVGGTATVPSHISSQFLSGLLMAAPLAQQPVILQVDGELVSKPYVRMTVEVMKSFGVHVDVDKEMTRFAIEPQANQPTHYDIEPDASAASYFWATAAICGGRAQVNGLSRDSLQGDVGFVDCLEQMGCGVQWNSNSIAVTGPARHAIDIDMGNISDTVQTLSVVALFVNGTTRIRNIAHNRVKETDRIADLATELRKLDATVVEHDDAMEISPGQMRGAQIETYNDHRMAMSLALAGLKSPGVVILDPGCVSKTYPNYFDDMDRVLRSS